MQSIALCVGIEFPIGTCYDMKKGEYHLKKLLMIDLVVLIGVLGLSYLLSLLTKIATTDLVFIGAMLALAVATILLVSARKDMKQAVKQKSKLEKKQYVKEFRWGEKYALSLFTVTVILCIISFYLAK